jgi:DNA-binding response OmpR family regulator
MGTRVCTHASEPRLLLVEDSEDVRTLMTAILEAEGYVIESASTAEEGLRLMRDRQYDLVLSDYALPGRTGAWMLREAVARRLMTCPDGIIVTAHPHPRDTEGFEVIRKPLDFDAFLDHVRERLDRRDAQGHEQPVTVRQPLS